MTVRAFNNSSVLVTGGGTGIGAGTVRYLAERGARVTLSGRREAPLQALADELGDAVCAVQGDITIAADRATMIERAIAHGDGLDGLVNNAGNMYRGELADLKETQLLELFHTNVIGAMLLTGLAVPALQKSAGAVVFLGSIHNRRAFPGVSPYTATKGAIEALTRSLAAELGSKKIRVNCVAPGAVFSEINQRAGEMSDADALERLQGMASRHVLGRIGTAEEVAEAIAYLLQAEWTTGAILDVDGGLGLGLTNE